MRSGKDDEMRWRALLRKKGRTILVAVFLVVIIVNLSGVHVHPFELDINSNFSYPSDIKDLKDVVARHMDGEELGPVLDVKPINEYNYRLLIKNEKKCKTKEIPVEGGSKTKAEPLTLMFMVKSALKHRSRRDVIRKTWGFEERFADVNIRRLFVVGSCDSITQEEALQDMATPGAFKSRDKDSVMSVLSCQDLIDEEQEKNGDMIQADFLDTYYNNTIKTMVGMKWLVDNCPNFEFALFVDDDYYVSTKNLLKFIRDPFKAEDNSENETAISSRKESHSKRDFDGRLYAGYVFNGSSPMRHRTSKWYVSLDEYRYSTFPAYVTAGAFVLSNTALREMFYMSLYTQHFRFDDIYLGILAKRLELRPHHSEQFFYWRKQYSPNEYRKVIASHGFDDVQDLRNVWLEQKSLGHA